MQYLFTNKSIEAQSNHMILYSSLISCFISQSGQGYRSLLLGVWQRAFFDHAANLEVYSFQEQFQQYLRIMLRAHRRFQAEVSTPKQTQSAGDSISTDGSNSPRYKPTKRFRPHNKEKSELCKKFTEFGYCPYQKKCKFAHGYHQLRKNNSTNMKYKTKECVTFLQNGFCHYGSRCNFIHQEEQPVSIASSYQEAKNNYREIFYGAANESRLLAKLLQQ